MIEFITVFFIALCAVVFVLDVVTSKLNNGNPNIHERIKFFADENGDTLIGKLIVWKVGLFAVVSIAAYFLYFYTADGYKFVFLSFALMSVITGFQVWENWRLFKKFAM